MLTCIYMPGAGCLRPCSGLIPPFPQFLGNCPLCPLPCPLFGRAGHNPTPLYQIHYLYPLVILCNFQAIEEKRKVWTLEQSVWIIWDYPCGHWRKSAPVPAGFTHCFMFRCPEYVGHDTLFCREMPALQAQIGTRFSLDYRVNCLTRYTGWSPGFPAR